MTAKALYEQVQLDAGVLHEAYWQGSRITNMLNQAQDWLQGELIKQGFLNWKKEATLTFSSDSFQNTGVAKADAPSDWHKDMPIEQIMNTAIGDIGVRKPAREVQARNFISVVQNTYLTPTLNRPIFVKLDREIIIYPDGITATKCVYTRKILDLVHGNDSTECEIPEDKQAMLIDRVVQQINVIKAGGQLTQLTIADIDKRIMKYYQLDAVKDEARDKKVIQ
jgi:hypothetical protein